MKQHPPIIKPQLTQLPKPTHPPTNPDQFLFLKEISKLKEKARNKRGEKDL